MTGEYSINGEGVFMVYEIDVCKFCGAKIETGRDGDPTCSATPTHDSWRGGTYNSDRTLVVIDAEALARAFSERDAIEVIEIIETVARHSEAGNA